MGSWLATAREASVALVKRARVGSETLVNQVRKGSETLATPPLLRSRSKVRKQLFVEQLEPQVAAAVRRKSTVRLSLSVPGSGEVPHLFTDFRSLSVEWNLCDKVDPARRVDVVADIKLQRKRQKCLFVDKCTRLRAANETLALARNELEILCYLANFCEMQKKALPPNLVHIVGYFSFQEKLHVVLEFCELGSLMSAYIESPQEGLRLTFSPSESEVCDAMFQICTGLSSLHDLGVAHGDLSLENIFVTCDNLLKIGDLEHAVFVGSNNQPQVRPKLPPAHLAYCAPEFQEPDQDPSKHFDLQKADVWSLGVIFILLLTKKPLFDSASQTDNGYQVFARVGLRSYMKAMYLEQSAICRLSDDLLNFAEGLLCVNPTKRFTMREALNNKWLKNEQVNSRNRSASISKLEIS